MTSENKELVPVDGAGDAPGTATKPKKRPSNARYDWEAIEDHFINGIPKDQEGLERTFLNLKQLAEHHGVPYQRMKERSSKFRWAERRQQEQTKLVQARQKKRIETLAKEAVEFDDKALGVAKIGLTMVQARLAEIANELQEANARRAAAKEKMARGVPVDKFELYSAINYREMEGLSRAAETFQNIGRRSLGTDVERHQIEVDQNIDIHNHVSVAEEITRDDSERLASILAAARRSGLLDEDEEDEEIMDGEVVEEGDEG